MSVVRLLVILVAAFGAALAGWGVAGPIDPGFDLFETTTPTFVDIDGPGPLAPIGLRGLPIGPGSTDTIVQRLGGLPPGGTGPIPIELVQLSLVSVAPITISGTPWDVTVTGAPSPAGTMTVTTHNDGIGGGTFDSFLPVNAVMTFTEVGNPGNSFPMSFFDIFHSSGSLWGHVGPPDYPTALLLPSGNFVPGVDPGTNARVTIVEQAQNFLAVHSVTPATGNSQGAIPEPASIALLGFGLLALRSRRRVRR